MRTPSLFSTWYCKQKAKKFLSTLALRILALHTHTHMQHATHNTPITLSAFFFAAVNYQLSIVSTHFVQRQQTSTYGMIFLYICSAFGSPR